MSNFQFPANFPGPIFQNGGKGGDESPKATIGIVLAVVGLVAWYNPTLGLPITVTGLVLSIKGLQSKARGLAIAALFLCCVGAVLSLVRAGMAVYPGIHQALENPPAQVEQTDDHPAGQQQGADQQTADAR